MTRGRRGAPAGRDPRELVEGWAGDPGLSGSARGEFTLVLANQLCGALWGGVDPDPRLAEVQQAAALQALRGIAPRDPVEGMLAAQMVATHDAAMECFRRAHLPEQTSRAGRLALAHAGKLVRSFAALTRGAGPAPRQGPADRCGSSTSPSRPAARRSSAPYPGGGGWRKVRINPMQGAALADAPEPALRGPDAQREPVPLARGEGQAPLPDARRRAGERGARGERNGRYRTGARTAEARALRAALRALARANAEALDLV